MWLNPVQPMGSTSEHHRALPYTDVLAALRKVRLSPSQSLTSLAFEFMELCASRAGEVRNAEWTEIDWESATWIIPSNRMKARREHAYRCLTRLWQSRGMHGS